MAAPKDNQNAKKERTRVSVPLSIGDKRLMWAIRQVAAKGVEPTDQAVKRFIKDYCYDKIDNEQANV